MNFAAMLMRAPTIKQPEKRAYNPRKIKPKHRGSQARYRLYLEGQHRSIPELAALMGYTYSGTRSSINRMEDRGEVKKVRETRVTPNGRRPALYTWVKS